MKRTDEQLGIRPAGYDKNGPMYLEAEVTASVAKDIALDSSYYKKRAKNMSKDVEAANEITEKAIDTLTKSLNRFFDLEKDISGSVKRSTGGLRDSANKLATGLKKIEGMANFERLEKYVELLERADKAISSLAELERTGKLEKIAGAIR